jgi:hypothetical protein
MSVTLPVQVSSLDLTNKVEEEITYEAVVMSVVFSEENEEDFVDGWIVA